MNDDANAAAGEDDCPSPLTIPESILKHNLRVETLFGIFNGVSLGMLLLAAPVIVLTVLNGDKVHITLIACAFPCGAFLGPLWAALGRRWGMKRLVLHTTAWANLLLFAMYWVDSADLFTALIVLGHLLHSATRMGQSSMYRVTYPRPRLARVLGVFTFCTFLTMVPTAMLAGWFADADMYPHSYKWLFPAAGLCGLIACRFYSLVRTPAAPPLAQRLASLKAGIRQAQRVMVADKAYRYFQLAFFLSGTAFFISNHITLYLAHEWLHFDAKELALWMQVLPMLSLAVTSPLWGRLMDRIGIVRGRLLISCLMTLYLACYLGGLVLSLPILMILGSMLRGFSEGGGQVTWAMASVHFAPRHEDVPVYNGIHFMLNGIRGLVMPWVGSGLFLIGALFPVAAATAFSAASILVILRSLRYGNGPVADAVIGRIAERDVEPPEIQAAAG